MTLTKDTEFVESEEPCEYDGTTTRYKVGNNCVRCTSRRNAENNRKEKYVEGKPCPICKGIEFFKRSLKCVDCTNEKAQARKIIRRGRTLGGDIENIKNQTIRGWQYG